jgi:hypothetical protein
MLRNASLLAAVLLLPLGGQDKVDLGVVHRIKTEAFDNSRVMETLEALTDRYGPRLTGSPEIREAAEWTVGKLKSWGVENVRLEKWGPFGKSWDLEQYSVEMIAPRYSLMTATPLAWTAGTSGPVTGEPFLAPFKGSFDPNKTEEELKKFKEKYKGQLRDKVVLLTEIQNSPPSTAGLVRRYTDAELADLAIAPTPKKKAEYDPKKAEMPDDPDKLMAFIMSLPESELMALFDRRYALRGELAQFLISEGALAVLETDRRAHDDRTAAEQAVRHESKYPLGPPTFTVTEEHYNRIARLLGKHEPVRLRINMKVKTTEAVDSFNITGEIPGGAKRDEIVMIGAHFDSWHGGTGATDNGAGSSVMLEVMRILKTLNLPMARTVRIGLWTGEEQGLLGSKAYVKEHFADPKTMQVTAEHARLSGYFNLDNGAGKIRGVYLENHEAMRPFFEQALAPFRDMGVTTISIRHTGGTDHLSFDAVGLPGFQFIQDPLDYMSVTHHGNMDVYDHAPEADLMQASAVIASVVYDAANRAEMLPRKPLPKPEKK